MIATEAKVSTQNILLLRQNAGLNLHHHPDFSGIPVPADDQRLLSDGLRPALPLGICCRVTVKLHQKCNISALHQTTQFRQLMAGF
ncbi:TPA: hypothetical protein VGS91_001726 [Citrobacter freundii]|nr:hypothetical protein [Citrobacter freundii]HEQ3518803.1 hypothetical protein [Citrobacter freundii]